MTALVHQGAGPEPRREPRRVHGGPSPNTGSRLDFDEAPAITSPPTDHELQRRAARILDPRRSFHGLSLSSGHIDALANTFGIAAPQLHRYRACPKCRTLVPSSVAGSKAEHDSVWVWDPWLGVEPSTDHRFAHGALPSPHRRIKMGTILVLPLRLPVALAKAAVEHGSSCPAIRLIMGMASSWYKREQARYGIPASALARSWMKSRDHAPALDRRRSPASTRRSISKAVMYRAGYADPAADRRLC